MRLFLRTGLTLASLLIAAVFLLEADGRGDSPGLAISKFRGHAFQVRMVDPRTEDLRLFLKGPDGQMVHDFSGLEALAKSQREKLVFAANAGMFRPDSSPAGLLVLDGQQISPLNLQDGTGNFYLKPNGVFALTDDHRAVVTESSSYVGFLPRVLWATQSGPLMVSEDVIHPEFNAGSVNLKIRSGIGVRKDGVIIFALSLAPVNFYDFALFFRDQMKCPNALFLDGDISAFHVAGEPETPGQPSFGPIFGIVAKQ